VREEPGRGKSFATHLKVEEEVWGGKKIDVRLPGLARTVFPFAEKKSVGVSSVSLKSIQIQRESRLNFGEKGHSRNGVEMILESLSIKERGEKRGGKNLHKSRC